MNHQKRAGFSLGELCAVLLILSVVAAILFPMFATPRHEGSNRRSCTSNIKQIELAMLQYIQDYDEKFPPCAQPIAGENNLSGWAIAHTYAGAATGAGGKENSQNAFALGLLSSYAKSDQIFRCPSAPADFGPVTYMYNDLAAGVAQKDFAAVANTILICDGEDLAGNVGHSYEQDKQHNVADFARDGTVPFGVSLQTAPLRHFDGANYGFVDGHVRWNKPEAIFFPQWSSKSRSHKDVETGLFFGPDPTQMHTKKAISRFGIVYVGTFHIK